MAAASEARKVDIEMPLERCPVPLCWSIASPTPAILLVLTKTSLAKAAEAVRSTGGERIAWLPALLAAHGGGEI